MSNARKLADNLPREGQLGNRNIIINGAMQVAQRGTSFTTVADGTFTTDRFNYRKGNDGEVTITQDSSGPDGFANSLKVDVTTADASLSASQLAFLEYNVEACWHLSQLADAVVTALPGFDFHIFTVWPFVVTDPEIFL